VEPLLHRLGVVNYYYLLPSTFRFSRSPHADDLLLSWLCVHVVVGGHTCVGIGGRFVGDIDQRPPQYSAIHVQGKRLHAIARSSEAPVRVSLCWHAARTPRCCCKLVRSWP